MALNDFEVFEGKKFSELMKDIYDRSDEKKDKIATIIDSLKDLLITIEDAVSILPMIKECFDVGVRNDEQLVKMANVVQRLVTAKSYSENDDSGLGWDVNELEEIKKNANAKMKKLREDDDSINDELSDLEGDIEDDLLEIDENALSEIESELLNLDEDELEDDFDEKELTVEDLHL